MLVTGKAKGGFARAASLTPEQRKAIAQRGAAARWSGAERKPKPRSALGSKPAARITELHALKTALVWSNAEIARRAMVSTNTVTGWFRRGPPGPALAYLRLMVKVREAGR